MMCHQQWRALGGNTKKGGNQGSAESGQNVKTGESDSTGKGLKKQTKSKDVIAKEARGRGASVEGEH